MRKAWLPIAAGLLAAVLIGCGGEAGTGAEAAPTAAPVSPTQSSSGQIETLNESARIVRDTDRPEASTAVPIATQPVIPVKTPATDFAETQMSIPSTISPQAGARELGPVPAIPAKWIATAESNSVNVYLVEPTTSTTVAPSSSDEGKLKNVSRANLIVENLGATVVRIGDIWVMSDPACYPVKGRSIGFLMQAFIVADDWLAVSAIPSESVVGMFSERTYFREEQDIWAR